MWKVSVVALGLSVVSFVPQLWAAGPELPRGPMQQKATTACAECHDAGIIVQQRLDKKLWTKEVDKMIRWGALVDPQDREALIDYLNENFAPGQPAYVPERTKNSRK
jgi:hypothetical protein